MGLGNRELTIDQSLAQIGEFGLGQKTQIAFCSLAWTFVAFQTLIVLFTTLGSDSTSLIECSKTAVNETCSEAVIKQQHNAFCTLSPDQWTFKSTGYSLVTEFSLVCSRTPLLYAAAACYFLGILIGCGLWHLFSETIAPRRMLSTSSIIAGVSGCLAATAPFLWTFMIFRIGSGIGTAGMGIAGFILTTDLLGPSWRGGAGLFLHVGFSLGAAAATLLAWWLPSWRWVTLLSALLPLGMTVTTWSMLVESPQWLLIHGRKGEATAAIAAVAFTNKTRPPQFPLADPSSILANPHRSILDILRNSRLRRASLLLSAVWIATSFCYYATLFLYDFIGTGILVGDGTALQLALTGFMYEIPGIAGAGLVAERLGRKYALLGGLIQAGGCLLGAGFAPRGDAQRALVVGSRFGLAGACSILYLMSWEMFPTQIQYQGLSVLNYAAKIANIGAPWLAIAAFNLKSSLVPLILCGALCLWAAVLASLVPETLGAPSFETIQEMNSATGKRHRSWTHSLRSVFRPPIVPGNVPAGAISLPLSSSSSSGAAAAASGSVDDASRRV